MAQWKTKFCEMKIRFEVPNKLEIFFGRGSSFIYLFSQLNVNLLLPNYIILFIASIVKFNREIFH